MLAMFEPTTFPIATSPRPSRAALKLTASQTKLLDASLRNLASVRAAVAAVVAGTASRGDVAMAVRAWGASWRVQLVYALLVDVVYDKDSSRAAADADAAAVKESQAVKITASFSLLAAWRK